MLVARGSLADDGHMAGFLLTRRGVQAGWEHVDRVQQAGVSGCRETMLRVLLKHNGNP